MTSAGKWLSDAALSGKCENIGSDAPLEPYAPNRLLIVETPGTLPSAIRRKRGVYFAVGCSGFWFAARSSTGGCHAKACAILRVFTAWIGRRKRRDVHQYRGGSWTCVIAAPPYVPPFQIPESATGASITFSCPPGYQSIPEGSGSAGNLAAQAQMGISQGGNSMLSFQSSLTDSLFAT
jgi:hypothetical protein